MLLRLFHGTTKFNFTKIKKQGFIKCHSFWTPFQDSAVSMGGPFVFIHEFENIDYQWLGQGSWEYVEENEIYLKDIYAILKVDIKVIKYNTILDEKLHKQQLLKEKGEYCFFCKGKQELTYINNGHHFKPTGSSFSHSKYKSRWNNHIIPCPVCVLNYNPNYKEITITINKVEQILGKKWNPENKECMNLYIKLFPKVAKYERKINRRNTSGVNEEPKPPSC